MCTLARVRGQDHKYKKEMRSKQYFDVPAPTLLSTLSTNHPRSFVLDLNSLTRH